MNERAITVDLRNQLTGPAKRLLSTEPFAARSSRLAFDDSPAERIHWPADANLGLSCGNPWALTRIAMTKPSSPWAVEVARL